LDEIALAHIARYALEFAAGAELAWIGFRNLPSRRLDQVGIRRFAASFKRAVRAGSVRRTVARAPPPGGRSRGDALARRDTLTQF
jgi:hypothetical protein